MNVQRALILFLVIVSFLGTSFFFAVRATNARWDRINYSDENFAAWQKVYDKPELTKEEWKRLHKLHMLPK